MDRARWQHVVDTLSEAFDFGWFHAARFEHHLETLAKGHAPDDDAFVAGLARFADLPVVHAKLEPLAPAVLVPALQDAWTTPGLRDEARRPLLSLLDECVLLAPESAAALTGDLRTRAEATLARAGRSLPPMTSWPSPWATKKKRAAKPAPPTPPPFEERVHAPPGTLTVADLPERDAQLERQWNLLRYKDVFHLRAMGDATALRLFRALVPTEVYVVGAVAGLVHRFGVPGLEASLAMVKAHPSELAALAAVESPRVAPLMAKGAAGRPALQAVARAWAERYPEAAVLGLVPDALGSEKEPASRAAHLLRALRRWSPEGFRRGLARFDAPVRAQVEQALDEPAELPSRRPQLPDWLVPARLPWPIAREGGSSLRAEALGDLLALLKATPLEGAPWVPGLQAAFSADSLAMLSMGLLQAWLAHDAPPKERWLLHASAHLGDDATATLLSELAAFLAPKGLSARAQEMVEVLGAMKSRTSLGLVHQLSRKVRSKAFRARTELVFTQAAEAMGLTEDELAERLVPDFGLTPEGRLPVTPPVRLEVQGLKVRFVDEARKPVKQLPEAADEETQEVLGGLKKRAAGLVREAAERLERRMAGERTMGLEHFTEVYVMNALLRAVGAGVVWRVRDGGVTRFARLVERGLVEASGAALTPSANATLGVAHPLELDDATRAAFLGLLPPQPFEQLERRATRFASLQAFRDALEPLRGRAVPTGRILALEKRGWVRGEQVGGGCYVDLLRRVDRGNVDLAIEPGVYLGDPTVNPQQTLVSVAVNLDALPSAVALSELERDLVETFGA